MSVRSYVAVTMRKQLGNFHTAAPSRLLICAVVMAEKTKRAALRGVLNCILKRSYKELW